MKLEEAITYAIDKEGTEIIGRSLLVNYLADLQAYDTPAVKRIVETIVSGGYGEKLLDSLQATDYDLQMADTVSRMVKYEGYQQDLVEYVLSCIGYALGKSTELPVSPVTQVQGTSQPNKSRTVTSGTQKLSFIQTSNGYQTELDGETYVIGEREHKAIMLMKDMPIERLKIWLKAYEERQNYNIQIYRHSFLNLSTVRPYSCLFKERGIVMTNAIKRSAINQNIDSQIPHSDKIEEIISKLNEEKAKTAKLWITLYKQCTGVINLNDLVKTKAAYEREWKNKDFNQNSYFIKPAPKESDVRSEVVVKADKEFDIASFQKTFECEMNKLQQMIFAENEPTIESVRAELSEQAIQQINSILPWKCAKLRKEFIESHIDDLFKEEHSAWNRHLSEFISKKDSQRLLVENKEKELNVLQQQKVDYINKETKRIHDERMQEWNKERNRFFEFAVGNFQDGIDGDSAYIESAIGVAFNEVSAIDFDLDMNMKFFC